MNRTTIAAALIAATITPALSRSPQDDPILHLASAYTRYAYVSWCHEARAGYSFQAISGAELDRAKLVVKAIEAKSIKEEPGISTDSLWKNALQEATRFMEPRKVAQRGFAEVCQDALRQLYELSPSPVYSIAKP